MIKTGFASRLFALRFVTFLGRFMDISNIVVRQGRFYYNVVQLHENLTELKSINMAVEIIDYFDSLMEDNK